MEERALDPRARVRGVLLPAGAPDGDLGEGGDVLPFWLLFLFLSFWALARRRRRNCSLFIVAVGWVTALMYWISERDWSWRKRKKKKNRER